MQKEGQPFLFPPEKPKGFENQPIKTVPILEKPKAIKGSEAFTVNTPVIEAGCLNKITGEISYGNGALFWRKRRKGMVDATIAHFRLAQNEAEAKKIELKNAIETSYANQMDSIDENGEVKGAEFYIQQVLHFENIKSVSDALDRGLSALWEAELTFDEYERRALETSGFIILQIGHEIANSRQGIYYRDPRPAYASEFQYGRKADLSRKRNKQRRKEGEKLKPKHSADQDRYEFSTYYYQERLEHWEKLFQQMVPDYIEKHKEYKTEHEREIRRAGGDQDFSVAKEKPQTFEEVLRSSENYSAYILYSLGLQALRNPYKIYKRRSEKVGFALILKAFGRAGIDQNKLLSFKGFFAFALYEEYFFKLSQALPKDHARKKEWVRQIVISETKREKTKPVHTEGRINIGNNEDIPF